MEFEARQFVRKVLLIHGGLLLLVLLIVGAAVRLVYASARQQAIVQAQRKQELLAKQTGVGIANYYESVTGVLNLLQPSDAATSQPTTRATNRRFERGEFGRGGPRDDEPNGGPRFGRGFGNGTTRPSDAPEEGRTVPMPGEPPPDESPPNSQFRGDRFRNDERPAGGFSAASREQRRRALESGPMARMLSSFGLSIWENIRDKASMLFVVDPADDYAVVRVIGTTDPNLQAPQIAAGAKSWLGGVHQRSVSSYRDLEIITTQPTTTAATAATTQVAPLSPTTLSSMHATHSLHNNAHLVAMPIRGPGGLLMVAVIPISSLEHDVLEYVNRSMSTEVILLDDKGTFVSAANANIVGHNVSEFDDPHIRMMADKYIKTHTGGSEAFDDPRTLGGITIPPGISTIEPIDVLGQNWFVVFRSTFDEVDSVVKPIFRDAVLWSGFLLVAMAVILVSTSSQLILGRVRLERMQRQVMAKEIDEARKIQLNWLPVKSCTDQSLHIAATNIPATHISGDFYNWFDLPDGRTVVSIGDVTGHGMSAAFLMATTQLLVRNTMQRVFDPGEALEEVNRQLCVQAFAGQFVTLNILVLDPARCTMLLANAGHPAPLIGPNADGKFDSMDVEPQLVLGVDRDAKYPPQTFELNDDATMLLYTDGLLDAVAPAGERFKLERLIDALASAPPDAEQTIAAIKSSIDHFRAGRDLPDDLTIVAVRMQPQAARV